MQVFVSLRYYAVSFKVAVSFGIPAAMDDSSSYSPSIYKHFLMSHTSDSFSVRETVIDLSIVVKIFKK